MRSVARIPARVAVGSPCAARRRHGRASGSPGLATASLDDTVEVAFEVKGDFAAWKP